MSSPSPAARGLSFAVLIYQRTLSPLLGPRCRFHPSCSAYALESLQVHGAIRGSRLALWRLLRCQPFGTPGYDPVPPRRAPHRRAWHRNGANDAHADGGAQSRLEMSDHSGNRPTQGVRAC
jgi:putative membrane protein insertion efficiency factor